MIMLNTPYRDQGNQTSFDMTNSGGKSIGLHKTSVLKTSILAVISAFSASACATAYIESITNEIFGSPMPEIPQHKVEEETIAGSVNIDIDTISAWNNYTLNVLSDLIVEGDTYMRIRASEKQNEDGVIGLHSATKGADIILKGNVDLKMYFDHELDSNFGANTFYVQKGANAEIGGEGTTTTIWSIASSPDVINVKLGSSLTLHSTKNQVVGTIDMTSNLDSGKELYKDDISLITGTFAGSESYWFGDEASHLNSMDRPDSRGYLNLTFKDGAQWSYLGIADNKRAINKRITNITLEEGGIINLFDDDLKNYWQSIGLYQLLEDGEYGVKHDYVRIGDLKGSGGIFRLELDGENKSESDVVFVENSSDPGMHHFQPHNLHKLESITPENTLIFALVGNEASKEGNRVTFDNVENLHGETLYDYELEIASEKITAENWNDYLGRDEFNQAREEFLNEETIATTAPAFENLDSDKNWTKQNEDSSQLDMYDEGEVWYIRRVTLHESAAAQGMAGAGWASYGAAIEMDRHDRHLAEMIRGSEDPDNGLWVRASRGRFGVENQYGWDRAGVTLGFDRAIGENNRLGLWFAYTEGDTELLDVKGDGNMKRYELGLFDTMTFGAHYVDLVMRLGRVSSEFNVSNASFGTAGKYDQDFAAISAEYGYTLKDAATGVFVEPQLRLQGAWLDGYDYSVQRGISADVDSATSLVGRVGLRTGKEFSGSALSGTVYVRGDVMHQITDGQNARFSAEGDADLLKTWGDFETWTQFGFGAALTFKDRAGLQVDLSRIAGGVTEDSWLLSGRLNYRF